MNIWKKKKKTQSRLFSGLLFALSLVCCGFISFTLSQPVNAVDLSVPVYSGYSFYDVYWQARFGSGTNYTRWYNSEKQIWPTFGLPQDADNVFITRLYFNDNVDGWSGSNLGNIYSKIYPYGYQVINIRTQGCTIIDNNTINNHFRPVGIQVNGQDYIIPNFTSLTADVVYWTMIYRNQTTDTSIQYAIDAQWYCDKSLVNSPSFSVLSVSAYDGGDRDYTDLLTEVNTKLQQLVNKSDTAQLQAIKNAIDNSNTKLNAINQTQQQTNQKLDEQKQQDKQQYEAEKQEESNRENQQSSAMGGIGFNFSVVNPFSALFSGFSSGNSCASIPIIAGMLNSTNTQYCPWFSANTRNIVTPVVSIVGMVILFGFVVHWLAGSDFAGSVGVSD